MTSVCPWYSSLYFEAVSHFRSRPFVTGSYKRSFLVILQKCRWKVTAKHACTLHMQLCLKRHDMVMVHGCMNGVHWTHQIAAVSCGISHITVSAVSKPLCLVDITKCTIKKLVTPAESCLLTYLSTMFTAESHASTWVRSRAENSTI